MSKAIIFDDGGHISFALTTRCPICDSGLIESNTKKICRNGCYEDHEYFLCIFDYLISTYDVNCEKELYEQVRYWKENDRYLMKIMTENN